MTPLLEVEALEVRYPGADGGNVQAVAGAGLAIGPGELVGLVGESGCGKSSLGRAILGLVPAAGGSIRWRGRRIDGLGRSAFRGLRRELQLVYQDPHASLDPRMTIGQSVAEPLRALVPALDGAGRRERVLARLLEMGLAPEHAARYPHQLSGGQLQRAVIARALIVDPAFVVFDEPVSALDVSVQGQIVELLAGIRRARGLAGLFISHNLAVVAQLCARVLVMYRGRIVESGPRESLLASPRHPYTRALLDAVPPLDPGQRAPYLARHAGAAPADAAGTAAGCAYAARCGHVLARCREEEPASRPVGEGAAACHRAGEWPQGLRQPAVD